MKTSYAVKVAAATAAFLVLSSFGSLAAMAASPAGINLGTAGNFAILAKTGISTTGTTAIVGDIGLSPAAATYITGFTLTLPAAGAYSTSPLITGKVYAPVYADPTSANLTVAVLDMQAAYTDGLSRAPDFTEIGAGNIAGLTLAPGVYKWGTGVIVPTDVTLSGGANDVWIFQIAQTLTVSSGAHINLAGGAQAKNIYWVVAGQTTIGTGAAFNGIIIDQTAVVMNTGASLNGRALAQTAVTLDSNAVTAPSSSAVAPAQTTTPAPTTPVVTPVVTTTTVQTSSGSVSNTPSQNTQTTQTVTATQPSQQVVQGNAFVSVPVPASYLQNTTYTTTNVSATAAGSNSAMGQQIRTIAAGFGQGSAGNNVTTLQLFLISQNKGSATSALARVGATGHFGPMTRAALAEFQAKVGIKPALGYFGAITKAYIAAHF